MAKIIAASLSSGKVMAEGFEIQDAVVLSEGEADSEGVLILDGDKQYYIAKTTPDVKTTIEKVVDAIDKIANLFTAIGAGMTGPTTAPPGTLATDVAAIQAVKTELETLKDELK